MIASYNGGQAAGFVGIVHPLSAGRRRSGASITAWPTATRFQISEEFTSESHAKFFMKMMEKAEISRLPKRASART